MKQRVRFRNRIRVANRGDQTKLESNLERDRERDRKCKRKKTRYTVACVTGSYKQVGE
jgi:hypothetical protein